MAKRQFKLLFYLGLFFLALAVFLQNPTIVALLGAAWALHRAYRLGAESRAEIEETREQIFLAKLIRNARSEGGK